MQKRADGEDQQNFNSVEKLPQLSRSGKLNALQSTGNDFLRSLLISNPDYDGALPDYLQGIENHFSSSSMHEVSNPREFEIVDRIFSREMKEVEKRIDD